MIKISRFLSFIIFFALSAVSAQAAVTEAKGWFEAAYAQWEPVSGAADYNVYIAPEGGEYTQLDKELVRKYPSYYRADAVGLKAGSYTMKIVPVDAAKAEMTAAAMTTATLTVKAHDRAGFAHVGMSGGIGAYKNDGTLKDGAKVIYVWADNASTVSTVVTVGSGKTQTAVGMQDIIYLYQKGYDKTPIAFRIIGTIKKENMDELGSSAEGLQIKGKNGYADMPITIEGIGNDAAISGFGILCRSVKGVELRNFSVQLCMDDCISLDTDNSNIWIHNMDFFYGNTGGDADQAKGDGTVDIKSGSTHITMSYCHFIDCGKASLGGMSGETTSLWQTFHHNWFDHSDSRHPRIRAMFFHVYNNYYDGISKYGIGATSGGSAFVESNYFRNCKYPMLISKQGTDAEGDGTFSGEPGGVIKAYDNVILNPRKVQYYNGSQTDGKWDAVLASSREESISAKCYSGGTGYNNEADAAARSQYIEFSLDKAADVPAIVKGWYGAGRMGHGDIKWTFNNSVQDENYDVISEMKSMLQQYRSTLEGFADGTAIKNGGATQTVDAGDGKGIDPAVNDAYVPSYAGGGGSGTVTAGNYVIGSSADYFWTIADNAAATEALIADGTITLSDGSSFQTTKDVTGGDGTVYSDKIGSLSLAKEGGHATFYHASSIHTLNLYMARTGSFTGEIQGSNDGAAYTKITDYSGKKGIIEESVTPATPYKYIRVINSSTGSLNIQGIKIAIPGEGGETPDTPDTPDTPQLSNDASATFTLNGSSIAMSGTSYTLSVPFDAAETQYAVSVTPAEKATLRSVTGATENGGAYVISAPAPGETTTATFTIVAENGTTVKTYTISIAKGVDPATLPASEICHFLDKAPSLSYVTVSGNYSNSKGSVTHNGTEYDMCLKIESATNITITPPANSKVTLVFDGAGKRFKLDGETLTTGADGKYAFDATGGQTYTLTKGDSMNLFLIIFEQASSTGITLTPAQPAAPAAIYTIDGKRVNSMQKGGIYIIGGKKVVM